jgi:hypothetical protein
MPMRRILKTQATTADFLDLWKDKKHRSKTPRASLIANLVCNSLCSCRKYLVKHLMDPKTTFMTSRKTGPPEFFSAVELVERKWDN